MKCFRAAISGLLTLVLLATPLVGAMPAFAADDTATGTEEVQFDYEFDASGTDTDIEQFVDDFYVFNPTRAGTSTSSLTAHKPTDEITSGTTAVFTRSGYPGVIVNSLDGSHYGMMSYKTRKFTEFYAEYTTIDQAQIIGMAFGSPLGKAGIVNDSGETAADNDQAVFITYRTGNFYIAGAVDTTDVTFTNVTQSTTAHWLTSTMLGSNVAFVGGTATTYTSEITVCAQVEDGYLTAWIETEGVAADAQSTIKVKLTDAYKGGVVSLFHGSNSANTSGNLSYFSHFGVRDISEYDTDLSFAVNEYVDYLNADFDVSQFKRHPDTVADADTFFTCEPSAQLGGYTVANTSSGYGGTNAGLRFNTTVGDGNTYGDGIFDVMPYTAHTYTNFYAEYDIVIDSNGVGLAFGLDGKNAGVSSDSDDTNDRAVYIRMNNDGSFYAAGAVDTESVSVPATTTSTSNLSQIVDTGKANIVSGDIGDAATTVTIVVKVLDGWMYLQYKGYDGIAKVKLTDAYVGGYVALYAAANYNATAFTGFRVKLTDAEAQEDTTLFNIINPAEGVAYLDEDFHVYQYDRAPATEAASKAVINYRPNETINGFNGTGKAALTGSSFTGLRVSIYREQAIQNKYQDVVSALTYKTHQYTDFYAEYDVTIAGQWVGLSFGTPLGYSGVVGDGELSNDSAVYIVLRNGVLYAAGALDVSTVDGTVTKEDAAGSNYLATTLLGTSNVAGVSTSVLADLGGAVEATGSTYTVCVEVTDGKLRAWLDLAETPTVMEVDLTEQYEGGYVSLFCAAEGSYFTRFDVQGETIGDLKTAATENEDGTYTTTITVDAAEGRELYAGSLIAMDKYGNQYIPERAGFREDNDATVYVVNTPYAVNADGRFIQPTAENPNIGNIGNSISVEQKGIRFLSRISCDFSDKTITLDGEKKPIKDYGMLLGLESAIGENELTLAYKQGKSYIQQISHLSEGVYYDYCDGYVDLSVCVVGLDGLINGEDLRITGRAYVTYDDGTEDGATLYTDPFTSTYADVLRVYDNTLDTVYLSADGHDANFGDSAEQPVLTVDRAMQLVKDGGTIEVIGTYELDAFAECDKAVTFTGGTLDMSALSDVAITCDTTFDAITLKFADSTTYDDAVDVFAQLNALTINESVTMDGAVNVYGGYDYSSGSGRDGRTSTGDSHLVLNAGNYYEIAGANKSGYLIGDTNVTVGGTAKNENLGKGGGVFGGAGRASGYVHGVTHVTVNGGEWESIYGGNGWGTRLYGTNVTINGGTIEQVFGGSESVPVKIESGDETYRQPATDTAYTNIVLNGGTITRRVYGGCYNEVSALGVWDSSNCVTGTTSLTIGEGVTFDFDSSNPECGVWATSRYKSFIDGEDSSIYFTNTAAYEKHQNNLGRKVGAGLASFCDAAENIVQPTA